MGIAIFLAAALAVGGGVWWKLKSAADEEARLEAEAKASAARASKQVGGARKHWLVGSGGELANKTFHIGERMVTIGRKPTNFVQIVDSDSSRIHCHLRPAPDGVMTLTDMSSRNGTFVNGQRIRGEVRLRDRDSIRIGAAEFRYHAQGDFSHDDARERKSADATTQAATATAESLDVLVARALRECNGDVIEASRMLQVPPAMVQTYADRAAGYKSGINPALPRNPQ